MIIGITEEEDEEGERVGEEEDGGGGIGGGEEKGEGEEGDIEEEEEEGESKGEVERVLVGGEITFLMFSVFLLFEIFFSSLFRFLFSENFLTMRIREGGMVERITDVR